LRSTSTANGTLDSSIPVQSVAQYIALCRSAIRWMSDSSNTWLPDPSRPWPYWTLSAGVAGAACCGTLQ
jgi:hypothetical protein